MRLQPSFEILRLDICLLIFISYSRMFSHADLESRLILFQAKLNGSGIKNRALKTKPTLFTGRLSQQPTSGCSGLCSKMPSVNALLMTRRFGKRADRVLESVKTCATLQSVVSNLTLESEVYHCDNVELVFFSPNALIKGSHELNRSTTLVGYNAVIYVSAIDVFLEHVTLLGDWKIFVAEFCSLHLSSVFIDHADLTILSGGKLFVDYLSVSRQSLSFSALRINATSAYIEINNSLFNDNNTGSFLEITGISNRIFLRNTSFLSMNPLLSPDQISVYVTGIFLALEYSDVTIMRAKFQWCGLRALKLTGSFTNLTLQDSDFYQNTGVSGITLGDDGSGGAVGAVGLALRVTVVGCSMTGQWSDTSGGSVALTGEEGQLQIHNTTMFANQVGESGGAIFFQGALGVLVVTASSMTENIVFGFDGGAIAFTSEGGSAVIEHSRFENNVVYGNGGALFLNCAKATVMRSVVGDNIATGGGGIYSLVGEVWITDSSIVGNFAGGDSGGGIRHEFCSHCNATDSLLISNCTLLNNVAADGGGISVVGWGHANLSQSVLNGNFAFGSGGGALYNKTVSTIKSHSSVLGVLEMTECVLAGNTAKNGDGGGFAVLNGAVRVTRSNFSLNDAAAGNGGGLVISGYPYAASDGSWHIEGSLFRGNRAGQTGGAISSRGLFYINKTVFSGQGIPFYLNPDLSVLCRGMGTFNDRRVVSFSMYNATITNKTIFDPLESPSLDSDALVAGISNDSEVVIMYLNWHFQLVAVNATNGHILDSMSVPPIAAYTRLNDVAGSLSATLPILIPKVADTNYYWYYVYGGWGLSSAVTEDLIFVSTFHKTVVFNQSNNSFNEVIGCASGVSAMTLGAIPGSLFLARYSGTGYSFSIYTYSVSGSSCQPYSWPESQPSFNQIRALAASNDGETLFVAETYQWVNQLREYQTIKRVNLKSGDVSYVSSSPTTFLLLDSVTAILPVTSGSVTELFVLCAPGGWLGGIDGQQDIFWAVYKIMSGTLIVENTEMLENQALVSGGAMSALDVSGIYLHICSFTRNYAANGGALIAGGDSYVAFSNCLLQSNSAVAGGALFIDDSAQVALFSSNFSMNTAENCGGALQISSSKKLDLRGTSVLEFNEAVNGGGICSNRARVLNQSCHTAGVASILALSSESTLIFERNLAYHGGGAWFDTCTEINMSTASYMYPANENPDKEMRFTFRNQSLYFHQNIGGYGEIVATPPRRFLIVNGSVNQAYYPGEAVRLKLAVEDG